VRVRASPDGAATRCGASGAEHTLAIFVRVNLRGYTRLMQSTSAIVATTADKPEFYRQLQSMLRGVITGETDPIANQANFAALVYHSVPDLNWAGFYRLQDQVLVLGPFQGRPACVRIPVGKGVCGTAVARREAVVVPDVHAFPGHIACDSASRSELAVPVWRGTQIGGVFDLDSPLPGRFDQDDAAGIGMLLATLMMSAPS
jgi:L-methionine (R)-S-oxide reductase